MKKIDWFYLKVFLHPSALFSYLKMCWKCKEILPKEVMLVSNRELTQDELDYADQLEPIARQILEDAKQKESGEASI